MDFQTGPQGELLLRGELNIYSAEQLLVALKDHLQTSKGLQLDLAGVQSCDPIGLQLLISAEKTVREAGKTFRITATSESFRNACAAVGLTHSHSQTEIQSLTQP